MTEYGADTIAGLHTALGVPFSEESKSQFLEMYHRVFDEVESVAGEQVWNLSDFQKGFGTIRVDGNIKGGSWRFLEIWRREALWSPSRWITWCYWVASPRSYLPELYHVYFNESFWVGSWS